MTELHPPRRRLTRPFLIWLAVLAIVWVAVNWPRGGGTLKSWMKWAGFPRTFAYWENGQLQWFDWMAFLVDLGGLVALIPIAWLCAWSRAKRQKYLPPSIG